MTQTAGDDELAASANANAKSLLSLQRGWFGVVYLPAKTGSDLVDHFGSGEVTLKVVRFVFSEMRCSLRSSGQGVSVYVAVSLVYPHVSADGTVMEVPRRLCCTIPSDSELMFMRETLEYKSRQRG